jgi:hypothetical protein
MDIKHERFGRTATELEYYYEDFLGHASWSAQVTFYLQFLNLSLP